MPPKRKPTAPAEPEESPCSESRSLLVHAGLLAPWIGLLSVCLKLFGPLPFTADQAADLTAGGKFWVREERDVLVYVSFIAALIGALFLAALGRRFLDPSRCRPLWLPLSGFSAALLPPLLWKSLAGSAHPQAWCAVFACAAAAHTGFCLFRSARRENAGSSKSGNEKSSEPSPTALARLSPLPLLADALVPVVLFLLIHIPDPALLAGRFFQIEEFFHWNGFLMTGALAFKHGLALYKDFIPVYGAGWPVLFGSFAKGGAMSYSAIIPVSVWVSVLYFWGFYLLSRSILRCRILAAALCLFAAVAMTFPGFEPENKSIIWRWSGGFPMRAPTEIAFFLCLWRYAEFRSTRAALLCGASAALTLFFAIDLGVYITAALIAFWCYVLAFARRPESLRQSLSCLGAFALTAALAFLVATRGALFQAATFSNVFDYIARTCGGFGLVPFADLQPAWVFAFAALATGLVALVSSSLLRPASERVLLHAFAFTISLYSLERMVQFMGRTMWSYLLASAVPFLLAAATMLRLTGLPQRAGSADAPVAPVPGIFRRKTVWLALLPAAAAITWFALSPDLPNYPALWNPKARAELSANTLPLLPNSTDVTGIPAPYQPYLDAIAQLTQRLRTLSAEGSRIQFLDACSTTFYALADVPPFGRDSNEMDRADISKKEIARLVQDIAEHGPDVIVLSKAPFPWPRALCQEAWQAARDSLFSHYRWKEQIGPFEIWRRNKPAAN